MKKIMFNDKYGLTQAVLEGRKTQTRRIITDCTGFRYSPFVKSGIEDNHGYELKPKYEVGEVIAIAQSYKDAGFRPDKVLYRSIPPIDGYIKETACSQKGWNNKMFVASNLMSHQISITNVRIERLQDISDEDCLKEGIYEDSGDDEFPPSIFYEFEGNKDDGFDTPREAFAALIDKVSGKGTWESNPYVWAYEFELMK